MKVKAAAHKVGRAGGVPIGVAFGSHTLHVPTMAKHQYLSSQQKSIVNRYYANQDSRVINKLQELASDLYLTSGEAALKKKWESVERELLKTNASPAAISKVVASRDPKALAVMLAAPGLSAAKPKTPQAPADHDDV